MLFLRQKIVKIFPKNWVFQKIIGVPKFCIKISGEFCFGAFCELLQGLEVQNKSNTMRTPLWPLGKEFRWFQRVVHTELSIWRHDRSFNQFFWTVLAWSQKSKQFGAYSIYLLYTANGYHFGNNWEILNQTCVDYSFL